MLSLMLTPCLLFATLAYSEPNEADAAADLITRAYSLDSALPPRIDSYSNMLSLAALPLDERSDQPDLAAESDCRFSGDRVIDLISRIVTPTEWELQGRVLSIDESENPLLIVSAPAETQAEVERFLAFLGSYLNRQARVRIETFVVTTSALPTFNVENDNRATLSSLVANGTLLPGNDITLGLTTGLPKAWNRTRDRSFVHHHETEIAQGAAISSPTMSSYRIGERMLLRADFGLDSKVVLRFAVNHTDELKPMRLMETNSAIQITTQDRVQQRGESAVAESPQLGFTTLAGSLALVPEKTRVVYSAPTGNDEMDRRGLLVAVTLEARSPVEERFTSGQRTLVILDTAGDLAAGIAMPQRSPSGTVAGTMSRETNDVRAMIHFAIGGESSRGQHIFETAIAAAGGLGDDNAVAEFAHGFALLSGELSSATTRALGSILARRSDGMCLGSLETGARGASVKAPLFALPLGDTPSLAWSGFAETVLAELSVDVATNSAISNSQAVSLSTGRFTSLASDPRTNASPITIELEQCLRRGDPVAIEQRVDSNSRIERLDFDRNRIRESLVPGQNSATFPNAFLMLSNPPQSVTSTLTTATLTVERGTGR